MNFNHIMDNTTKNHIVSIYTRMMAKFPSVHFQYEYNDMSGVHSIKILTPNLYNSAAFQEFLSDELYEYAKLGFGCNITFYDKDEEAYFISTPQEFGGNSMSQQASLEHCGNPIRVQPKYSSDFVFSPCMALAA